MTNYTEYIEEQTEDLMTDISRLMDKGSFNVNELKSYIKSYANLKLNVVYQEGKLDGMRETKKIFTDEK